MKHQATERCVGCGALVPRVAGPVHRYMTSAPGCWALWGALNARLMSEPSHGPYRQLIVDTYAVQHPGTPGPRAIQSVGAHLVSLYAQLERGFPSDRFPRGIESLIRAKGSFHWLAPPSFVGASSVADIVDSEPNLEDRGRAWATSVWQAWTPHHEQVKFWYDLAIGTSTKSG
jgi:hypothetical protein